MNKQENALADYLDNVRYYCETSAAQALPKVLKKVFDLVENRPEKVDDSLAQAMDLNIRQLLKNMLTERVVVSDLPLLQRVLSVSEAVLMLAEDNKHLHKYQPRWKFAYDVINDRMHEMSVDKHKVAGRPKVKALLKLLASRPRVQRDIIEKELGVSKQGATNIVRDLKAFSLIEEFTASDDKRKKEYSLSVEGVNVCQDIGIRCHHDAVEVEPHENLALDVHQAVLRRYVPGLVHLTTPLAMGYPGIGYVNTFSSEDVLGKSVHPVVNENMPFLKEG
ncbi:MarR family winged helix-turn-helix transcriptional regulator [Alteromonas antoniana]|uniref:MarR family winged helix-turn-helix transcriptional regulator n=1 Tax=Alteromonas antoniana TaxID=2803813 RepID=UPI001C4786CA|nr:MarR family winged helix-turn-helix transcriptional regulator [Alteromonas antoniana]